MAHFAELDENNAVKQVIVVHNNELLDENGVEQEQNGINFCINLFGGRWVQTSYNNNFRKYYAAVGMTYDPINDVFIPPQPYPSWFYNNETFEWKPPVKQPSDLHIWNEETQSWFVPDLG